MNNQKFYECYSFNLKDFLYSKGFRGSKDKHKETGRFFWVFKMSSELSQELSQYSKMKSKK